MLVAAAFVPSAPVLVPEIAQGAAHELEDVRAAGDEAVCAVLESAPDLIIAVGTAPRSGPYPADADVTLQPWGGPVLRAGAPEADRLPLSLAMAHWWLDRAESGAGLNFGVTSDEDPDRCAAFGHLLADGATRVGVIVVGDASATRSPKAPGSFDARSEEFDLAVIAALDDLDHKALLSLDPLLSLEVKAQGRAPWQVAAGMVAPRSDRPGSDAAEPADEEQTAALRATVHATSDLYGVQYVVATWLQETQSQRTATIPG